MSLTPKKLVLALADRWRCPARMNRQQCEMPTGRGHGAMHRAGRHVWPVSTGSGTTVATVEIVDGAGSVAAGPVSAGGGGRAFGGGAGSAFRP